MNEHLYIIAYDIRDEKRWRCIFKLMKGYGTWLQLSIFQCRLSNRRKLELIERIKSEMDLSKDHVILIDIGPDPLRRNQVISLGKPFSPLTHQPIII